MTTFKYSDVEDAFMFVSSDRPGMNRAVLCKDTGKTLFCSETGDIDEIDEQDELNWGQWVEVPHKKDLGLGIDIVFEFVQAYLPEDYDRVRQMFRRRGAYASFKALLERRGLLQQWYDMESEREEQALREWCKENGIQLSD